MGVILLVIAALLAAGLAIHFYKRSRRSNNILSDYMAAELSMKASQLESYKAMLRNPNPQSQSQPQSPPRNQRGIDWDYVADDKPRRF